MKAITIALAAFTAIATAQSDPPFYDLQSNPFHLVLKSSNASLDGHLLGACHQGAAIEGLCLTTSVISAPPTSTYYTFYHNVSTALNNTANANATLGVLNYALYISSGTPVSSSMIFAANPGSNTADLVFRPGWSDYQLVAFDDDDDCGNTMYVPVYQDDSLSPPTQFLPTKKAKSWWLCLTRYSYLYTTLVWKWGFEGVPQNPSCQAVEVVRVWA